MSSLKHNKVLLSINQMLSFAHNVFYRNYSSLFYFMVIKTEMIAGFMVTLTTLLLTSSQIQMLLSINQILSLAHNVLTLSTFTVTLLPK